ncbi:MAG: hypothetical protein WD942_09295 [Dehalococcoidia bacterium]
MRQKTTPVAQDGVSKDGTGKPSLTYPPPDGPGDLEETTVGIGELVTTAVIVVLGVLGLRWVLAREADRFIRRVIVWGLVAKIVGTVARYTVMAELYGGVGDFGRYFAFGTQIAAELRDGQWPEEASETGSSFMDFLSGITYLALPDSLIAGFALFSALSFIGAYLFLAAFRLAVPDGDHRRYAVLIFFVPTMIFWPSSLGKEAWLVLTLGLAAYGGARVLRRERWGYVLAVIGVAAMFGVRPHMAALFAVCLAGAFVLRFRDPDIRRGTAAWFVGLLAVGLGAGLVATNFGDELPQDESIAGTQAEQIFAETARRTTTGGSSFDSRPVRGPGDLGHALLTVPFRPFPWEGDNFQARLAGLEGFVLLLLVLGSLPRLLGLVGRVLRQPYVALATAYTLGFVVAFSNVGNFGILTRQRAQLIPLMLVLLCLPPLGEKLRRRQRSPVLLDDQQPVGVAGSPDELPPSSGPLIPSSSAHPEVVEPVRRS